MDDDHVLRRWAREKTIRAGHEADTERLKEYWVHGKGAAKIQWGVPGDFLRCVSHLGKYVADPKGLCANMHHEALGVWPGQEGKH